MSEEKKDPATTENDPAGDETKGPATKTEPKGKSEPKSEPAAKAKKVRVIVPEGRTLGRLMLVKDQITDDPEYVALLDVPGQEKVALVK